MELVYLWVEDYKNIHKQGFNFSPRFRCEYDEEKNELTINENKDYVSIFPDNMNITAIVGENGSGKSTLLKNIDFTFGKIDESIYFINDILYSSFEIDITTINNKTKYELKDEKLDIKIKFFDRNFFTNLPNKGLFNSFFLESKNLYRKYFSLDEESGKLNIKEYHKKILKSILLNKHLKNTFFNPREINISFNMVFEGFKLSKDITDLIYKTTDDFKYQYKIYLKLKELISHNNKEINEEMKIFLENKNKILSFELFDDNDDILLLIDKDEKIYKFLEKFVFSKDILQLTPKKFEFNKLEIFKNEDDTRCFMYLNKIGFLEYDFFDEKKTFSSLSSGEKNFFVELTILNNEIKEFLKYEKENRYLLLIFDESDTTFHPQWQKNFLNEILNLLKNYKRDEIRFQIVITSHSPFILSDFPKENVIFLEKFKEEDQEVICGLQKVGNCKNASDKVDINPFGANIHTLLSHGFFMKDGLMGEFAKEKINSIISYHEKLLKKELTKNENKKQRDEEKVIYEKEHKTKFRQIQSIIGDDYLKQVIKNHLVEIEKILYDEYLIDKKIKKLEDEIERLKRLKK
ncbi:AAA family ATPase [Aliarcobacter butzleri]|uniref:AAA family ATPase n=1 Tax=Aliarcobacter butzleri TaxID=28197 RepID=UPI003B211A12